MDRKDVNINSKSCCGETPLWEAAHADYIEIFRFLLDPPDIEINFQNNKESPLTSVAKAGNQEIFELLLKRARNETVDFNLKGHFLAAAEEGNVDVFQMLLDEDRSLLHGVNDEIQTPLCIAARWGKLEIAKTLK